MGLGVKGIESRKNVESDWVITIPFTKPIRFAMLGANSAVSPMIMLAAATSGPVKTSVTLNRR